MPNIKSAAKRMRQSAVRRSCNRSAKSAIHTMRNKIYAAEPADKAAAKKLFSEYCSTLDKAVKTGIVKANTANRKKSRAAARLASA
jgi:small subunit ribosomal protein S20